MFNKRETKKKKFYLNRYTDMLHYLKSIYVIYAVFNVYARQARQTIESHEQGQSRIDGLQTEQKKINKKKKNIYMVTTNNMLLSYKEEAICYVFKEKKWQ